MKCYFDGKRKGRYLSFTEYRPLNLLYDKYKNERLTIKSQVKKWYFLIKVQKCILDIFWTQLELDEPWKLHDKKSIYVGAQKRSIELEKVKML